MKAQLKSDLGKGNVGGRPWALACLVAVQDFKKKDVMFLKVNKLSSIKNQLPYEYYSLPYCRPEKVVQSAENLGEVLRGDRIENSLYQVRRCSQWLGGTGTGTDVSSRS